MKTKVTLPLVWGLLHGVNDWVAGYLLAHYALTVSHQQSFPTLIIYSILAFGGQLPVGFWVDKNRNLKAFGSGSIILLAAAISVSFIHPFTAIIIAGIASAGIHVIGGSVCLMVNEEKTSPLGVFAAPGVAGLTLGGFCGLINGNWMLLPLVFSILLFILINTLGYPKYFIRKKANGSQLDSHDWLMLIILLVMCFRSFLFDMMNTFSQQSDYGLLVLGLSAFAGKLIGGVLCDKIGWKKWVYISLPMALFFLQIGHDNLVSLAFGVACLQSSVPVTIMLMSKAVPQYPATAFALSLGTAIAFAGLPLYASPFLNQIVISSQYFYILLIAVLLFLIVLGFWLYNHIHRKKIRLVSPITTD